MQETLFFLGFIAQGIDPQLGAARIQDTDHDLLAKQRGQRADPEVDHAVRTDLELHPAVLRDALLGNIHPRDHLDPGCQLVLDGNGR